MKNILTLLITCFALTASSQAPPIQRNDFTTNGNPAAYSSITNIASASDNGERSVNTDLKNWSFNVYSQANLNWVAFGDSTGLDVMADTLPALFTHLGSNGFGPHLFTQHGAGGATNTGSASGTNWVGSVWNVGTNNTGAGHIATTNFSSANGGAEYVDRFRFLYENRPDGGTFYVSIRSNGGSWYVTNILSSSNAYSLSNATVSLIPGWYQASATYSNSGFTRFLGHIDGWYSLGRGVTPMSATYSGSRISGLTNLATNILGPWLLWKNPTLITLGNLDSSNDYRLSLPILAPIFTNFAKRADIVIVGTHPTVPSASGVEEYDLIGQDFVAREFCRTNIDANGRRWTYLDVRQIPFFNTYTNLTNFYGAGDGIHAPAAAKVAKADRFIYATSLLRNAALADQFIYGTAPAGRRVPFLNAENIWGAGATWGGAGVFGSTLTVMGAFTASNGYLMTTGTTAGLYMDDQNNPIPSLRWRNDAFAGDIRWIRGADNYFAMGIDSDNGRSLRPMSGVSSVSRLGRSDSYWNELWTSSINSTNTTNWSSIFLGSRFVQTNNSTTTNLFLGPITRSGGVTIGPGGNVGIGTNAPSVALAVSGVIEVGVGSSAAPSIRFNSDTDSGFKAPFAGGTDWVSDGTASVRLQGSGGVNLLNNSGSVGFGVSTDLTLYRSAAGLLGIGPNASSPAGSLIATSYVAAASTAAPGFLSVKGGELFCDGTNWIVVAQNGAGGRTTNKLTMTPWP